MPTLPLPPHASLANLERRAEDLVRNHQARTAAAAQRIREFDPRYRNGERRRDRDGALRARRRARDDRTRVRLRELGLRSKESV